MVKYNKIKIIGTICTANINIKKDGIKRNLYELLSFPNIKYEDLAKVFTELNTIDEETKKQIEIEAMYAPYITREENDIELLNKERDLVIPDNFDYDSLSSLTNEVKEKLKKHRPYNIEIASRISGITPASIMVLIIAIKKSINNNG